ncbi:MAG TPA: nucleotidyltransferase [Bacteroidetes bacterium]|nr:nucleotidyltransferase [Bacteroidota bacterium]
MNKYILNTLLEELPHLRQKFNVEELGIFGSGLNVPLDKANDLDFFIKFKRPVGLKYFELIDYLEKIFNKKVDVITPEGLKSIKNKTIKDNISNSILYVN